MKFIYSPYYKFYTRRILIWKKKKEIELKSIPSTSRKIDSISISWSPSMELGSYPIGRNRDRILTFAGCRGERASLSLRLNARRGLSPRLVHVFRTKLDVDHSYLGQESCHLEQLPRRSVGKLGRWWPSFATDFLLIRRRETTSVSSLLIRSSTDSSGEIIISSQSRRFVRSRFFPLFAKFVSPNTYF